ncbi:antirestriction protein ArdA [Christensenellaceae bacterium OttesenSCG-928-L17]|nr:antirestriction protein ArdA [Christensenellaceae bacterium OttesenSCG-928-L17]
MSHDHPFQAYITNLGRYNEGHLVGQWHAFPTTKEEIQQTFRRIGIDGRRYEEYFITDYETDIGGLYELLPEYANLDELNYLASLLEELEGYQRDTIEAFLQSDSAPTSIRELINAIQTMDDIQFYPGISDEEEYGDYLIDECGMLTIPDNLRPYFDYEKFGRDVVLEEGGSFTDKGYLVDLSSSHNGDYDGMHVPEEYKVFALPNARQRDRGEER